jgi:hypothetical protein
MPVNLSQIRDLLLPGLRAVTGKYTLIDGKWDKLFEKGKSNMALERTTSMRYLPYAQLKTEGGPTAFDNNAGERYVYNQEHIELGLGYAITRKAIDDNLYKAQFGPSNDGLMESFTQTKEIYGAATFNTATTYDASVGGDGVALCATNHPIDGATIANRPTVDQDLNESSLLNAQIAISSTFKDNAGLLIQAMPRKLAIPPALEPIAVRLTKTELRPGTAMNDVNAILSVAGGIPEGYIVNPFFTSSYAWFLLTNKPGLLYLQRIPYEMTMEVEFTTDNLLVKGYERFSFSYFDWRSIYGSFPTS